MNTSTMRRMAVIAKRVELAHNLWLKRRRATLRGLLFGRCVR